jgi:uncharacterized membrane protein
VKRIRRYLVAGILVWVPLGVTSALVYVAVGFADQTLLLIPKQYQPDTLLDFHIPGLGAILAFVVLLVTGVLAANFVGRAFFGSWESLMERIPFVRAVYSAAKKFSEIVFSDSSQSFKKVLLIEYPRKGLYSLAFQTATELGEVQGRTGEEVVCCFVPTTPNPTSGLILIVPKKDVTALDMDVDEALKMVISLGVVVPTWRRGQSLELPLKMPDDAKSPTVD